MGKKINSIMHFVLQNDFMKLLSKLVRYTSIHLLYASTITRDIYPIEVQNITYFFGFVIQLPTINLKFVHHIFHIITL